MLGVGARAAQWGRPMGLPEQQAAMLPAARWRSLSDPPP